MRPLVSVIIPVYNRPEMAQRAVRSVLSQTYDTSELIVIDDGSTEDLSQLRELVEDADGRFICRENRGVSAARNLGVASSQGSLIAFLDSDDLWRPKKLEMQVLHFESEPGLSICQTNEVWYRNGRFVNPSAYHQKPEGEGFYRSLERCCISPSSVMLTRSLFEQAGGFDEALWVCEDYDLWLKITCREEVGLVKQVLVEKYGGHSDQLSRACSAMDRFRVFSILRLLLSERLSVAERLASWQTIAAKSAVLAQGAKKRGRLDFASTFEDLARAANSVLRHEQTLEQSEFPGMLEKLACFLEPHIFAEKK